MKNKIRSILSTVTIAIITSLFVVSPAEAMCPVCTLAVCCGMGLSRWLGIDDVISGIWVGAFMVSIVAIILRWLDKKNINFQFRELFTTLLFYTTIFYILAYNKMIGVPGNIIFRVDKLIFGITFGSILFILSYLLHLFLKKKNNNRVYFPFQKVIIPILFLSTASFIFYFLI